MIDPAPLTWGWHIDAICEHLQAVTEGKLRKLIINIAPGHAKSMIVSVLWPAWAWGRNPRWQALFSSYGMDLVLRDSVKCRTLMSTSWYQRHFTMYHWGGELKRWDFTSDQNVKSYYTNTALGHRVCLSVGSGTGWRGDALVIDDPLKASDAHSEPRRREVITWKTETMSSRFNDLASAAEVLIMQRLHEGDLTGYLLQQGGWEHLCLPTEFVLQRRSKTSIGWEDPRKAEGELLFEAKFPRPVVEDIKKPGTGMGSLAFAAQHQQAPVPAEGNMFRRGWWRFWRYAWEQEIPELAERTVVLGPEDIASMEQAQSWDCAFKGGEGSDLVAGGTWARRAALRFLLDLAWRQMTFSETQTAMRETSARWPRATAKLVEDKANGPAIIDTLQGEIGGLIAVTPEGGKEARAAATSPQVEAGNVYIPLHAPWRDRYVEEHASFPRGTHDDAVDQQSQMLLRWRGGQEVCVLGGEPA